MVSTKQQYNELGAVLVKARSISSDLQRRKRDFWIALGKKGAAQGLRLDDKNDRNRFFLASDFLRSCISSALFSANCFFLYYDIFERYAGRENFNDVAYGACDAAHVYADIVPIELFNAREVARSPEIKALTNDNGVALAEAFTIAFPHVKEARDAVTHAHDRMFSRFRDSKLDAPVGGRPICNKGKFFVSNDGSDFLFDFRQQRFIELADLVEKSFDL